MRTNTRILLAVCLGALQACAGRAADDLPGAIATLRQAGAATDVEGPARAVEVVRSEMEVGDARSWALLRPVLEDATAPVRVRIQLADVLLEKADHTIASDMLGLVDLWSRELAAGAPADTTKVLLLGMFIERFEAPPFPGSVLGKPAAPVMLSRVYLECYCSLETKRAALRAISASPAGQEEKRRVAEDIVSRQPNTTVVAVELIRMMDSASFPTLRALVRRPSDVDSFHYGAGAALGEMGDREIVPDLTALAWEFRGQRKSAATYLDWYLWKIQAQDPPGRLLEYIRSPFEDGVPQRRVWAIGRASELGLGAEEIRQAILAHASTVPTIQKVDPRSGRTYALRPFLSPIKAEGLRLGILRAGDIPDVATMEWR